jgi:hypothetical protein
MRRSTLIPLIGVVITVLVIGFIFFASEPDPVVVETGGGEGVVIEQDAGAPAVPDDTVVEE